MYPVVCLFISQKFKEMIVLIKTKKDLVHTIQTLLKVFPEAVLIRSLDSVAQRVVTEFANDYAQQFVSVADNQINISREVKVSPTWERPNSESSDSADFTSLDDFLAEQEHKLDSCNETLNQLVELKNQCESAEEHKHFAQSRVSSDDSELKVSVFSIKSVRVRWNNCDSYLHVLVNTTQIKKLERERANRECQQIMLASLSHDMRTPLNAFTNSLQLVKMILTEFESKFGLWPQVDEFYRTLQPRLEKYFKIGEISACFLLNLIEDVLDMSKFTSNTFKLNIEPFSLESVLTEIEFIFGFQCNEK